MPEPPSELDKILEQWSSDHNARVLPSAKDYLHRLLQERGTKAKTGSLSVGKPRKNLELLLAESRRIAGKDEISDEAVKKALITLCPLFPFC